MDVRANYPHVAAAGRRLRAGRQNRPQLRDRSTRHRPGRHTGLPERHLAHTGRSRRRHRKRYQLRELPPRDTDGLARRIQAGRASASPPARSTSGSRDSTYIRQAPYFDGITPKPAPVTDILNARVLAVLGDSVTTDHISPAGSIKASGPAGKYLSEHGVQDRGLQQLRLPPAAITKSWCAEPLPTCAFATSSHRDRRRRHAPAARRRADVDLRRPA